MTRKKGSKDYPIWMKKEAIRLSREEGWLNSEITEHFQIADPTRVKNWLWRCSTVTKGINLAHTHSMS